MSIAEATTTELKARDEVLRIEDELAKLIKGKESEIEKKIKAEGERVNQLLINVEAEIKVEKDTNAKRKDEINLKKEQDLSKKGADTSRLNKIDFRLSEIKIELEFIETNRGLVERFYYDKEKYLDKANTFKQEKQKQEKQLELEEKKKIQPTKGNDYKRP